MQREMPIDTGPGGDGLREVFRRMGTVCADDEASRFPFVNGIVLVGHSSWSQTSTNMALFLVAIQSMKQ